MIFLDSDIFVIDLRYHNDRRYRENKLFLEKAAESNLATTSIFNILEVCGILSFNLNKQQLLELYYYFPQRYNLQLGFPTTLSERLPSFSLGRIMNVLSRKASFGDSLIICAVNTRKHSFTHFISWNTRHFKTQLPIPAITPTEALADGIV